MKKLNQEIQISIRGTASRKLIAQSLRRIAKVIRTAPFNELQAGWDDEPVMVSISPAKIIGDDKTNVSQMIKVMSELTSSKI